MAKILFVHPLFLSKSPAEQASASPYFPLGLLYLAAYVREAGHEVALFDGTFVADESAFADALAEECPDVVGISAVLPTRSAAILLAQMASASGAVVIMGGPDATTDPSAYLDEPAVDIVVHHEGEQTITCLLDRVDAGDLTMASITNELGIALRHDGAVVINQPRPPIENLDELPMPARDLIDMNRYLETWQEASGYSSITISTSRGCPYNCDWCRDSVHGREFRQRSPESVAAEVLALKATFAVDRLRLVDDVDGIDRSWFEAWAAAAEKVDGVIPFEALNELSRGDLPMLDVRDSL